MNQWGEERLEVVTGESEAAFLCASDPSAMSNIQQRLSPLPRT
jgi:hypothetical protein